MKKILFLFVVLLSTLGAYAQSNTTPIKGDVNEDGVVDVADINAIIEIMKNGGGTSGETHYWYIGTSTTPPTASNYKTILTQVDESNNPYTFTNTNVRHYMYIIVRDTKSVVSIKDGQFDVGYKEYTDLTIPGYKVYRSNSAMSLNGSVIITQVSEVLCSLP